MADQSTMESTTGDASSYVSQSAMDPAAENKASSTKNRVIAVASGLALVAALIIIVLVFAGTSSSSGAQGRWRWG
ncbi:hypothetical protein MTO96_020114 [Rhipicephalus appendiculatus]